MQLYIIFRFIVCCTYKTVKYILNSIINKYQSGFRPIHSTTTALLNVTDDWLNSIEDGKVVIAVMLDLKKKSIRY